MPVWGTGGGEKKQLWYIMCTQHDAGPNECGKSSSHLYACLFGKARGSRKARSSSMSWSLILLTFSGLRQERWRERGGADHVYCMWSTQSNALRPYLYVQYHCAPTFHLPGLTCGSPGPGEQQHCESWQPRVLMALEEDTDDRNLLEYSTPLLSLWMQREHSLLSLSEHRGWFWVKSKVQQLSASFGPRWQKVKVIKTKH